MVVVSRGIFLHFLEGVAVGSDDVELSEDRNLLASSDAVCERVRLSFSAALVLLASAVVVLTTGVILDGPAETSETPRWRPSASSPAFGVVAHVRSRSRCDRVSGASNAGSSSSSVADDDIVAGSVSLLSASVEGEDAASLAPVDAGVGTSGALSSSPG